MASKLLVIKQTRPSLDVAFFSPTAEAKAEMLSVPLPIVAGERNIAGGLKKIRTLFFTNAKAFTDWQASQAIQTNIANRIAYNAANGIIEEQHTVEMPNYNPFK